MICLLDTDSKKSIQYLKIKLNKNLILKDKIKKNKKIKNL